MDTIKETVKPFGLIFGMLGVAAIFYLFIDVEDQLLDTMVSTGPSITLDEWREMFHRLAVVGISVSLFMALLWYVMGQWVFSLNYWNVAGKRWVWWGLLVLSLLLGVVPGGVLTPRVQEWGYLAPLFYLLNSLLVYYLGTLFFSPSSFKYTPVGAVAARHWW
jgi:hypothetical protein